MLKRWLDRKEEMKPQAMARVCIVENVEDDNDWIGNPLIDPRDTFRNMKIDESLSGQQKTELTDCLQGYGKVLTNVPGRTTVLKHQVVTTSESPVRQKPYQIPHAIRDEVRKEVSSMLETGIMETSIILQTGASDRGLGGVLLQKKNSERHPLVYLSKKVVTKRTEFCYSGKGMFSIVWAIKRLRKYLYVL
ncbi:uncharacterized protein LOC134232459 [Saccostrea cucullata]|uniref:uncharacterized protein LOC134232459 n=1 Tax=Saccostrea cuccullata TaxID=36930 RepID=UPI002ED16D44